MTTTLRHSVAAALVLGSIAVPHALAAPQIEYRITGDFSGLDNPQLQSSSLIINYTGGSTNGAQDIGTTPFNISRIEIFSDPNVTNNPLLYSAVRTFGYFGLLNTYDNDQVLIESSFFIGAQPGLNGLLFEDVFATYLSNHPTVTSLADFVQVLIGGPDSPSEGAGVDWIDFNSFVTDNGIFEGDILTTFQTGNPLQLIYFDNTTGAGSIFGDIQIEAINIPEPSSLALLTLSGLALRRRRRN